MRRTDFHLDSGNDLVRVFRPDGGAVKAFCSNCGSSLFGGAWLDGQEVSIRLGSKAPWDEIHDGLAQFEGAHPRDGKA